jgi:hypothetical protein
MTRRFGRNQKRHMREQLANEQEARLTAEVLAKYAGERRRQAEDALERVRRMLPDMSHLVPPKSTAWHSDPVSQLRIPVVQFDMRNGGRATGRDVPLDVMLARLKRDTLTGALHALVHFRDGRVCYSISPEALAMTPRAELADLMTYNIAAQLGRELARTLK